MNLSDEELIRIGRLIIEILNDGNQLYRVNEDGDLIPVDLDESYFTDT